MYYYNNSSGLGGSGTCNNCCCDTCGDSETCDSVLTVTTMQGLPIEGAIVTVYYEGTAIHITNSNGQVPLAELEDGVYLVTVDVDGYERAIETFTVEENVCPDISVTIYNPELTTCDATFTFPSQESVEGFTLTSIITMNGQTATANEDGYATITDLEDDTYAYSVTFEVNDEPIDYTYEGSYTVTDLDCQATLICLVIFRLYGSKEDVPTSGVTLSINGDTFTSGAGGYTLVGVLPSSVLPYHYTVTHDGDSVEGDFYMPLSGACPDIPYDVHIIVG